jgi:uncharacterized surface protein with fasciclin (FAS1) repeats
MLSMTAVALAMEVPYGVVTSSDGEAGECASLRPSNLELKTAQGESLTATMGGGKIVLKKRKGGMAATGIPNVFQSNGVIQEVDRVLQPA